MNKYANKRINTLEAYQPNEDIYKVKLDANESCYPIDKKIREEISKAILENSLNVYPDPMAKKVCEKYGSVMNIESQKIVAGNGSDELISVITSAFLEIEDTLLCFSPDFSMYKFYGEIKGCKVKEIKKGEDMILTSQMIIEGAKESDAKVIMFSNPCNPTGIGLKRSEVIEVLECVNSLVIVDEAYMDFWSESVLDLVDKYENLIVLKTASKALSMAGIRLGFAIANKELIDIIKKVKSPYNVSVLTQIAGEVAFSYPNEIRKSVIDIIENRKILYNHLKEIKEKTKYDLRLFKSGTNFLFIKCDIYDQIDTKLKEADIIIRNFNNGYLRISIGTEKQVLEVAQILKNLLVV